jgi:hypothetical protein
MKNRQKATQLWKPQRSLFSSSASMELPLRRVGAPCTHKLKGKREHKAARGVCEASEALGKKTEKKKQPGAHVWLRTNFFCKEKLVAKQMKMLEVSYLIFSHV